MKQTIHKKMLELVVLKISHYSYENIFAGISF